MITIHSELNVKIDHVFLCNQNNADVVFWDFHRSPDESGTSISDLTLAVRDSEVSIPPVLLRHHAELQSARDVLFFP